MKIKNPIEIFFQITPGGKYVIEMGEFGRLAFTDMTKDHDLGYKHITYSRTYMDMVSMKSGESRKHFEVPARDAYVFNMKFKRDDAGLRGVPQNTIPVKIVNWLIDTFDKLTINGYFPEKNMSELAKIIIATDFDDELKKSKPKVVRKKKRVIKKPTPAEIAAVDESFEILRRSLNGENSNS